MIQVYIKLFSTLPTRKTGLLDATNLQKAQNVLFNVIADELNTNSIILLGSIVRHRLININI